MAVGREQIRDLRARHRDGRPRRLALRLPGARDRREQRRWSSASGSSGPGSPTTRPARSTRSSASAARGSASSGRPTASLKFAWQRDWFDLARPRTRSSRSSAPARRRETLLDADVASTATSVPGHYRLRRPALDASGRRRSSAGDYVTQESAPMTHRRRAAAADRRQARRGERRRDVPDPQPGHRDEIGAGARRHRRDVDAAIAAARRAFDETDWSTNVELRVRCLRQLHQALLDHADEFRALTTAEVGMPGVHDGAAGSSTCRSRGCAGSTDLAESYEWETDLGVAEPMGIPSRRTVRREPVGVVAAITPWNFPHPDQPGQGRPGARRRLHRRAQAGAGHPVGGLRARPAGRRAHRPPAGRAQRGHAARPTRSPRVLTTDPRVDLVSFTGSTATGRAIMAAAAPTLKKVFLELGGKSAAIVLDDADVAAVGRRDGVRRVHPRRPGLRAHHPAPRPARAVRRGGRRSPPRRWRRSAPRTRPTPARSAAR